MRLSYSLVLRAIWICRVTVELKPSVVESSAPGANDCSHPLRCASAVTQLVDVFPPDGSGVQKVTMTQSTGPGRTP